MRRLAPSDATVHGARPAARYGTAHARYGVRDDADYAALVRLFGALADPTRAKIVHLLMDQERCTGDIAAVVGTSESYVSQHLRLLCTLAARGAVDKSAIHFKIRRCHLALLSGHR